MALKEWRRLERICSESIRSGSAFLHDDRGELRLLGGRPVLWSAFASAWQARRRVDELCDEESEPPPPPGVSEDYREWPSIEGMTMFFLVFGLGAWDEVGENLLVHYEQVGRVEPVVAINTAALSWE